MKTTEIEAYEIESDSLGSYIIRKVFCLDKIWPIVLGYKMSDF
jgi:uncharacterized protein Yka (UPF0111/DUF47 family)